MIDIVDISVRAIAELCGDLVAGLGVEKIALGGSISLADGYLDNGIAKVGEMPEIFRPNIVKSEMESAGPLLGALLLEKG